MKARNLEILQKHKINIPKFYIVKHISNDGKEICVSDSCDKFRHIKTEQFLSQLTHGLYAVRSSCCSEDGTDSSFAGQFETLLNVKTSDIPNAISRVFRSYDNKQIQHYSKTYSVKNNLVIVQEMINPEISGVLFTSNPNGLINEMVITVGMGLGCNVVEDKADTTTYYFNVDDKKFYTEHFKHKIEIHNHILLELIHIAQNIKSILKCECDIEFCICDNIVYILQARPITTLKGNEIIILDNSNIVESYPGIALPLTQDFVKEIYHDIFYNCLTRVSGNENISQNNDTILKDMVDVANWGMYYRITNWYSILKLLPCSSIIIPTWQRMLGVKNKTISTNQNFKTTFLIKIKMFFMFFKYLHLSPSLMRQLNSGFDSMFDELSNEISSAKTTKELIATYYRVKQKALKDWDITLINDMYAFIYTGLAGKRNETKISNIKNLESMKPILSVENLVSIKKQYGCKSAEYKKAFNKHVDQYGDRCVGELKLETKTYRTNPELLEQYIENYKSENVTTINEHSCDKLGFFVRRAKLGIENREISRLNRSRLFGLVRSLFLKAGQLLVEQGQIDNVEDVFYLKINEIDKTINFQTIINERKIEEKMFLNIPRFERLIYLNKIFNKTCHIDCVQNINDKDVLNGTPTSFGKVVAEVVVINNAQENINANGKILVTKTTDPGWVYLIKNAVGIVAEKGSLLSHTAIISRELKKPAVVNVENCTSILKTGDIVELDAEKGIIRRLSHV